MEQAVLNNKVVFFCVPMYMHIGALKACQSCVLRCPHIRGSSYRQAGIFSPSEHCTAACAVLRYCPNVTG